MLSNLQKAIKLKDELIKLNLHQISEQMLPLVYLMHAISLFPKDLLNENDKKFIEQGKNTLIKQGSKYFSFNSYFRESELKEKNRIPDNLNVTASALAVLTKFEVDIDEKFFLKLMQLEIQPGGPYRTWYVDFSQSENKKWDSVDPEANANLLYFASLYGINLFSTQSYLEKIMEKENNLMFFLAISKYASQASNKIIQDKTKKQIKKIDVSKLTDSEKLVYLLTTTYLGEDLNMEIGQEVVNFEQFDKAAPLLGSKVINSSLLMELLLKNTDEKEINQVKEKSLSSIDIDVEDIKKGIDLEMKNFPDTKSARKIIKDERFKKIMYVVIHTAYSLKNNLAESEKQTIKELTLALFFSWVGYTINDDILDGQKPKSLKPLAQKSMEIGWSYYKNIFLKFPEFEREIKDAFNMCDNVYEWEMSKARFNPDTITQKLNEEWDYDYIENRMMPFLISMSNLPGFLGIDGDAKKCLYGIFKSQMLIDQLSDDANDWKEDRKTGVLTYVLYLVFKKEMDYDKQDTIFWRDITPKVISICKIHYKQALLLIEKLKPLNDFLKKTIEKSYVPIIQVDKDRAKVARLIDYF